MLLQAFPPLSVRDRQEFSRAYLGPVPILSPRSAPGPTTSPLTVLRLFRFPSSSYKAAPGIISTMHHHLDSCSDLTSSMASYYTPGVEVDNLADRNTLRPELERETLHRLHTQEVGQRQKGSPGWLCLVNYIVQFRSWSKMKDCAIIYSTSYWVIFHATGQ